MFPTTKSERNVQITLTTIQLHSIGLRAAQLAQSGAKGFVLVRFNNSAYLQFGNCLLCIALYELGAGPLVLQLANDTNTLPAYVEKDAVVGLSIDGLSVSGQHFISTRQAVIFDKRVTPEIFLHRHWHRVFETTQKILLPSDGLARFIYPPTADSRKASALITALQPATDYLIDCMLRIDNDGLRELLNNTHRWLPIVGAGPGLTPSGDDFLAGLFCSLHLSGRPGIATQLWLVLKPYVSDATTAISAAMLEQSASGYIGEVSHTLLRELATSPAPDTDNIVMLANKMGHTSGWDWAAGLILGMNLFEGQQ